MILSNEAKVMLAEVVLSGDFPTEWLLNAVRVERGTVDALDCPLSPVELKAYTELVEYLETEIRLTPQLESQD